MAALTTQILIGRPHLNDGGIIPSHFLFLSEGNRPSWIDDTNIEGSLE